MNNLTGIFKVKKGSASQQNEDSNEPSRAPIGFEAFGSPNDQNVANAESVSGRFPGEGFMSFESGFNSSTFPSFEPRLGDFGVFGGAGGSNPRDFGEHGFTSGFGGSNFPSFESRFGDIGNFGNFGNFGGFDSFGEGFDGFGGGNPRKANEREGNGPNSVNIPVRPVPPTRPDPPKRPDPPIPSDNSSDSTKPGKSGFLDQAGRKIYGDIKNGIFSRFGEMNERRKDFDGFRKKFEKEPKRFRESFNHIVKVSFCF